MPLFDESIDSIQKNKANKHTKQRQSNKAQHKQLSSDGPHSTYSSCPHRPHTNLQKIALKIQLAVDTNQLIIPDQLGLSYQKALPSSLSREEKTCKIGL